MSETRAMNKEIDSSAAPRIKSVEKVGMAGVVLSLACAVHCLAAPFLLALAPAAGAIYVLGNGFEFLLIAVVLAVAVASSCWGFRIHRKKQLLVAFGAAATFIVVGQMMADKVLETVLVLIGGLGLVGSHFLNAYLCRICRTCDSDHKH